MLLLHEEVSLFINIDLVCKSPGYDDVSAGLASILVEDIVFAISRVLVKASTTSDEALLFVKLDSLVGKVE